MPNTPRFFAFKALWGYQPSRFAADRASRRLARGLQGLLFGGFNRGLTPLANSAGADRVGMTGLSNEIDAPTGDGWARIPYGEWPHDAGLQRFGRPEAEAMVGYFKNTWNRIKRAVVGMPIFRGHPDLAALANQYPDKGVYGSIADMEARDDGLYLRPVLSPAGAALVNEQGLKFFSPHWLARKLPDEAGKAVFAPAFMVSIGLTDRPNISGTSLVNTQPTTSMNIPPWLLALLGLANEATEPQVRTALAALLARPESTALANETTARTTAETALATATTKLGEAETALANERTALKAARAAHAETLVAHAIAGGRITEAQKATWLGRLERDFAAESAALANEKPTVKTAAVTAGLGARKVPSEASTKFHALVNERTGKGEAYQTAWAAVKATAEGKALFEQMSAPATPATT